MHRTVRLALVCLVSCAVLMLMPIQAASLGVSPTLLDLHGGQNTASVQIYNHDPARAVSVQIRLLRWQQAAGAEVETPTLDVVASPPVTRIAPGAEQLVRIVRTTGAPLIGEESYRLLIDELPEPEPPHSGTVQMLIRHSLPVFFSAPGTAPAQPQWQITRSPQDGESGYQIRVHNRGGKRLRLAQLELRDANDTLVAQKQGLVGYVLAQAEMTLWIPAVETASGIGAEAVRLLAHSETGPIETDLLPVGRP